MKAAATGRGAARRRPAAVLIVAAGLLLGPRTAAAVADADGDADGGAVIRPPAVLEEPRVSPSCTGALPRRWPDGLNERREQLRRLQALLARCIDDTDFLAVLGAMLLDDGDAAQALVWLERALLLDPAHLGARADHALALSELGEPAALRELARQWRTRTDLPPGLRARLYLAEPFGILALPAVRFGLPARQQGPVWGLQADASLLAGHESNLDRSPRLAELTLTSPSGPVVLPVISVPRKGTAAQAAANLQAAYSPWPSTVLRSALGLQSRRADSERITDWHQTQWSAEWLQRGQGWRTHVDAAASWIGGPLAEPYRLLRLTLGGEVPLGPCAARLSYADERRTQSITHTLDARARARIGGLVCPLPGTSTWSIALSSHRGRDVPDVPGRPGGAQKLATHMLRAVGTLGTDTVVDLHQRQGTVHDAEGYSPLLANNAQRAITLRQASIEVSQPLKRLGWPGLTAVAQWQTARQRSNLEIFSYRADAFYGGVRWVW